MDWAGLDSLTGVLFSLGWLAAWLALFGLSALVRMRRSKPILARIPAGALFVERRASGRSLRNFLTRASHARGVLLVTVTQDKLTVQPHFPFTLLFMPELYGLDVQVTPSQLRKVSEKAGVWGRKIVVEFSLPSRGDEQFELNLGDAKGFMAAVAAMKAEPRAA